MLIQRTSEFRALETSARFFIFAKSSWLILFVSRAHYLNNRSILYVFSAE